MPKNIKNLSEFDGQRSDEELLFVFRKHIISMRKGFYMLLIPFVVSSLPVLFWPDDIRLFLSPLFGLLVGLILFSYQFIMWYYSFYIVTNQRIRQITQNGLFGKDIVDLKLSKVQNISYNVSGLSGELFKFGTIVVQTYVGDLVINKVDNPDEIYNRLQDAVDMATIDGGIDEEIS